MNTIGMIVPAAVMAILHMCPENDTAVIVLMVTAVGFGGAVASGVSVHAIDVGGKRAGLIFGVMNSVAQVPGILGPIVVSYCVEVWGDEQGYSVVFWMCCALYVVGALLFVLLANAKTVVAVAEY